MRRAVLICLVVASCLAPCGAEPHAVIVRVDRPAAIGYTVQLPNQSPQTFDDPEQVNEKRIEVQRDPSGMLPLLTIHAVSQGNPFMRYEKTWIGRPKRAHYEGTRGLEAGFDELNLTLDQVILWDRLGAVVVLIGAVVGVLAWRQRRAYSTRLAEAHHTLAATQERLTVAEAQSGLFPVDGSNPRRIGRYDVVDRLGAGGMAVVYLVRNHRGEEYALKLPLPNCLQDEEFKRRFRRELKIGVKLIHPNLVRILDVNGGEEGEEFPYPFLVMELVKGRTLEESFGPGRPAPVAHALQIASQILDALVYVHEAGVIHRDIKPSNVMLTQAGRAKLMDFGVAHRQDTVMAGGKLTKTDQVLGTPVYMPPEQVSGLPIDVRADLYAVGILVYEMLAGELPFGNDVMQAIMMKMTEDLPPLTRTDLPPGLQQWIDRMTARDREVRFATAAEARDALQGLT